MLYIIIVLTLRNAKLNLMSKIVLKQFPTTTHGRQSCLKHGMMAIGPKWSEKNKKLQFWHPCHYMFLRIRTYTHTLLQ